MSFIQKSDEILINTKLTAIGRKMIASGALSFSSYAVGDSEINYNAKVQYDYDLRELTILRPKDENPDIKTFLIPNVDNPTLTKPLSNIIPIEKVVRNTAKERGFYTGNTTNGFIAFTDTKYLKATHTTTSNLINGTIGLSNTSGITVGDYIQVAYGNPNITYSGTNAIIDKTKPTLYSWHKVESIVPNTSLTVYPQAPTFNSGSVNSYINVFPSGDAINDYYGSGETTNYWNPITLAFNGTCSVANDDVPVWNFNIVYLNEVMGVTASHEDAYDEYSYSFIGTAHYLNYNKTNANAIGILHYTNKSINNFYGERFADGTLTIAIPYIMWHKSTGTTLGQVFKCGTTKKNLLTSQGINTSYYDLVDDVGTVVGKVFSELKIVVIEDEELLNVMSYTSARNFTLPKFQQVDLLQTTTSNPNPIIGGNQPSNLLLSYYITSSAYTNTVSLGHTTSISPCFYKQIYNSTSPVGSLQLKFNPDDFKFLNDNTAGGTGFTINSIYLLYQTLSDADNEDGVGQGANWKQLDITSKFTTSPIVTKNNLTSSFITITADELLNSGSTYTNPIDTTKIKFGEERFFLGNVNTDIEALVYQTVIPIVLGSNEFNTSNNPTWSEGQDVYISEVGIYDSSNNLVAISKISYPIAKRNRRIVTLQMSIDF